jgi:hypothetical protein
MHPSQRPAVRQQKLVQQQTANTEENQAAYPQPSSQKPGLGFPICRMVALICLASDKGDGGI